MRNLIDRVSKFYVRLMQTNGLIEKLDGIGSNLKSISDDAVLARYKQYIMADADATQAAIREAVRKEEAAIHFNVVDKVRDITEYMRCAPIATEENVGKGDVGDEEVRALALEMLKSTMNDQENLREVTRNIVGLVVVFLPVCCCFSRSGVAV